MAAWGRGIPAKRMTRERKTIRYARKGRSALSITCAFSDWTSGLTNKHQCIYVFIYLFHKNLCFFTLGVSRCAVLCFLHVVVSFICGYIFYFDSILLYLGFFFWFVRLFA